MHMKHPHFLALLLILATATAHAQVWYKANDPFGGRVTNMHTAIDGSLLACSGGGLFRSLDNGDTWVSISGAYPGFTVADVASTTSGSYIASFGFALRRTNDLGQSWVDIAPAGVTSMGDVIVKDGNMVFINTNASIWRSMDDGATWTQLTVAVNVNSLNSLSLSPDGELFAGTYNSRIYRSSDNGDTWTQLFTAANDIRDFAFDGNNTVYGATGFSGVYASTDNGDTWNLVSALPGTNGGFFLNTNSSGDLFIAVYDGGIFSSTDGGGTWNDITNDLLDHEVRGIFLDANDDLFVGTTAAGVNKMVGGSWVAKNQGLAAVYIERFLAIDGDLYACSDAGLFISTDGGHTWQQSIRGMDDKEIRAVAKAPNGDLYAGGEMLYRSQDGIHWTDLSPGFPSSEVTCNDLFVDASGRLIVATEDYGIRYTDNQGSSWTYANAGLEDVTMTFIRSGANGYYFTADGYDLYRSNDLTGSWSISSAGFTDTDIEEFAAGNGSLFATTYSDGLFRSMDNGVTWSLVNPDDFENIAVNGNEVYTASRSVLDGGVYFSADNGDTWNNIGNGLPGIQVDAVYYVPGSGLFAYLSEYGLYTLDFNLMGVEEADKMNAQLRCFPNPFSNSTWLDLQLEEAAVVTISILDPQGRLVDAVAPTALPKGTQQIRVGEKLGTGVYWLRVELDGVSGAIRLVKL